MWGVQNTQKVYILDYIHKDQCPKQYYNRNVKENQLELAGYGGESWGMEMWEAQLMA